MTATSPETPAGAPTSSVTPIPRDPRQPADFDPVAWSRRILRSTRAGALACAEADGTPFVSLVNVATDLDGAPLLLVSKLASHTKLMDADPRVSLLLADTGKGDPLAHPRLTIVGRVGPAVEPRVKARFLARHPKSALYADFPDFSFRRIEIARGFINGGFARAADLEPGHLLTPLADPESFAELERGAVEHMNKDHAEAVAIYARMAGAEEARWRISGLDPEGVDLQAGDRTARLAFPAPVSGADGLRKALVALAAAGRAAA